jgi:predicted neutral ceramidase superfamily lipid hydrolase
LGRQGTEIIEAAKLVLTDYFCTGAVANAIQAPSQNLHQYVYNITLKCSHITMFIKYLLRNNSMISLTILYYTILYYIICRICYSLSTVAKQLAFKMAQRNGIETRSS